MEFVIATYLYEPGVIGTALEQQITTSAAGHLQIYESPVGRFLSNSIKLIRISTLTCNWPPIYVG